MIAALYHFRIPGKSGHVLVGWGLSAGPAHPVGLQM